MVEKPKRRYGWPPVDQEGTKSVEKKEAAPVSQGWPWRMIPPSKKKTLTPEEAMKDALKQQSKTRG